MLNLRQRKSRILYSIYSNGGQRGRATLGSGILSRCIYTRRSKWKTGGVNHNSGKLFLMGEVALVVLASWSPAKTANANVDEAQMTVPHH